MGRPTTVVRIAVIGACGAYGALLYAAGVELDSWSKRLVGLLPIVAVLLLTSWDLWLWRAPVLQGLTGRPRLDGLWRVTLTPTAESHIPEGGQRGAIPGFLVVRQSFWSIHARQLTRESSSDSRSFFWHRPNGGDVERLTFLYENEPRQENQHRSVRHFGTCTVSPVALLPSVMTGTYFTDRYTKGDMDLAFVDRTRGHATYAAAQRHVEGGPAATRSWRRHGQT